MYIDTAGTVGFCFICARLCSFVIIMSDNVFVDNACYTEFCLVIVILLLFVALCLKVT